MTAPSTADIDFDPFAPRPFEELPPIWAELRDRAPVYRTAAGMYVVSRYDDVRGIQRSPGLFSNRPQADEASNFPTDADADPEQLEMLRALMAGFPSEATVEELTSARTIIAADPPDHTRIRRIVNRGFTPGRIAALGPKIDMIVDECLSGIETADGYDVVSRLAIPLPVQVIGDMLGIEPEMRPKIKYWTDGIAQSSVGDLRGTTEGLALGMRMLREFSTYLAPLVEQRRVHPQDDIISAMVRSLDDDTLSTAEALMMAVTIMAAGNETTTNLIGNAVVAFYENPGQLELLRADPSLLPNAVEEANRISSPIQFNFREALDDVKVAGTRIPKGATVILHLASANRDPRQFDHADSFRVDRPLGKNLAFGHGIHFCLGAHLTAQEARSALGKLLPHLDRFDLDLRALERNPYMLLHGVKSIPLTAKA
jgi:cytochrome P450